MPADQIDDVIQEAMMAAWRKCPRAWWRKGSPQLHHWLRVVVRRLAINRVRLLQRHPVQSLGAEQAEPSDRREEQAESLERREQLRALLNAWMEELREKEPDNYRLVQGRYFADRRIRDLAKDLGLSPNAVSQRLARLRNILREYLFPLGDSEDES
ncbi:MAG TPA: sigma-70 family RNA polymerase sigma factor [Gemmataceae bacterium]